MKATIELELEPFTIPNFVRPTENPDVNRDSLAIPLSALDSETLDRLCRDFRNAVFMKAGKEQPPQAAPRCVDCEKRLR